MSGSRPIVAWDGDVFVGVWDSAGQAANWAAEHGHPEANRVTIYRAAYIKRTSVYGYTWRFADGSTFWQDRGLINAWRRILWPHTKEPRAYCDKWRSFAAFAKWAKSAGYEDGLALSRRDTKGGFTPENCFWAKPVAGRTKTNEALRKPVVRISETGPNTVYGSLTEAAAALIAEGRGHKGGDVLKTCSNIGCALRGKQPAAYGYTWKYVDPPDGG